MIHLPRSAYILKPWKNGMGITEEIYVSPERSEDYLFRLSMASLSHSGPFSSLPGIDRTLVLLEGDPIRLNDQVVPLLTPVNFPGEEKIISTVSGKGTDFNLMCRRGKVSGEIQVRSGKASFPESSDVCIVFALTDSVFVGETRLRKYDSCLLESRERNTALSGENFLRINITYINV